MSDYSDSDEEYQGCCSNGVCSRGSRGSVFSCSSSNGGFCSLGIVGGARTWRNAGSALSFPESSLPFDPSALQEIILNLSKNFDFRVITNDGRMRTAMMITSGFAFAGTLIGKHYGGNVGAALGGAVGGVCGVGVCAVALNDIWEDVKGHLSELFDITYDYLAGLGMSDYKAAAEFLIGNRGKSADLAQILLGVATQLLKQQVVSSVMPM